LVELCQCTHAFPANALSLANLDGKLPVAERLHKRIPSYDHRCPMCSDDHEDDDHLFRCPHPTRRQWCNTLLQTTIHDAFGEVLDLDLMAILRLGLRSYFTALVPDFQSSSLLGI
jgi:zinc-binding in reverse transcriptase